jgi:hypothetical protein
MLRNIVAAVRPGEMSGEGLYKYNSCESGRWCVLRGLDGGLKPDSRG